MKQFANCLNKQMKRFWLIVIKTLRTGRWCDEGLLTLVRPDFVGPSAV